MGRNMARWLKKYWVWVVILCTTAVYAPLAGATGPQQTLLVRFAGCRPGGRGPDHPPRPRRLALRQRRHRRGPPSWRDLGAG